jgi:hypothetical protein
MCPGQGYTSLSHMGIGWDRQELDSTQAPGGVTVHLLVVQVTNIMSDRCARHDRAGKLGWGSPDTYAGGRTPIGGAGTHMGVEAMSPLEPKHENRKWG